VNRTAPVIQAYLTDGFLILIFRKLSHRRHGLISY